MQITVTDFWVIEEFKEHRPVVTVLEGPLRNEVAEGPFGLHEAVSRAKSLNYFWFNADSPRKFHVASTTREMVVELTAEKMIEDMKKE